MTTEKSMLPAENARIMALAAHLSAFVLPMAGPLIIWILQQEEADPFVVDQCKEALNFQLVITIAMVVSSFATVLLIGCLVLPLVIIAAMVFPILGAVDAYQGRTYRYPYTMRLIQ